MTAKTILLVEDDITLGDLIVYSLTQKGYQVNWYVRARLDEEGQLIFMTDRGVESNFDCTTNQSAEEKVDYDFALVDSRLKGCVMQGVEVTSQLTRRGVTVIATSGLSSLNAELIKAGAAAGIEKHELFTRLFKGDDLLQEPTTRPRSTK